MTISIDAIRARCIEVGDCLEWQGCMGTGRRNRSQPIVGRDKQPVRRLLWEAERGPIPSGRIVYCTCGNSRCVGHLALGKRGDAHRVRARLGLMRHTPDTLAALTRGARERATAKHSMQQARAVRELAALGVPDALISWATDVTPDAVGEIRRGNTWREHMAPASVFAWRPAA
jgi:hypothetical protein